MTAGMQSNRAGPPPEPLGPIAPPTLWAGDTLAYRATVAVAAFGWFSRGVVPALPLGLAIVVLASGLAAHALSRHGMRDTAGAVLIGAIWGRVRFEVAPRLEAADDRAMVGALLVRLLARAARACAAEPEPQVRVGNGTLEGRTVFFVSDNGPGPAAAPPGGDEAAAALRELVLATAHAIAASHGGELALQAAPGSGTMAVFSLPG